MFRAGRRPSREIPLTQDRKTPERERPPMVRVGEHLTHGLTLAGATLLFALGGHYLDRWLGTEPVFVVVGAVVGAVAGFLNMYWRLVVEPRKRGEGESGGSGGTT